ncbi:MAG TPA: efflux RND transporter periplasmic adaptor subunit [Chitinivibrionales bacterium]|nr:efflux RND transporter periplasmic adaptor subunit [Chitinivibrionales bacterium]
MRTVKMVLGGVAAMILASCGSQQSQDGTTVIVPVSAQEVKPQSISRLLETTGTVNAEKEVTLSSEVTAYYSLQVNPRTKKPYALNDWVEETDTIIRLSDEDYESTNRVEAQKLSQDIARNTLSQEQSLYDKGGAASNDLQNAQLAYSNAKYNYTDAAFKESKLFIKTPFAGVLTALPYYTQNTRVPSGSVMLSAMEYSRLYLQCKLPAQDMADLRLGQTVLVTNYTVQNDTVMGTVSQISPAIDPTSRTFEAVCIINNSGKKFLPGMFVKADIVVAHKDSTVVVPKTVVLSDLKGHSVFVVDRGRAQLRAIKTGIESDNRIEILQGVSVGDRLVVKGFETLQDGSRVKVLE